MRKNDYRTRVLFITVVLVFLFLLIGGRLIHLSSDLSVEDNGSLEMKEKTL